MGSDTHYDMEYQWVPTRCSHNKIYGHATLFYPKGKRTWVEKPPLTRETNYEVGSSSNHNIDYKVTRNHNAPSEKGTQKSFGQSKENMSDRVACNTTNDSITIISSSSNSLPSGVAIIPSENIVGAPTPTEETQTIGNWL